jgi:hypothetical protein
VVLKNVQTVVSTMLAHQSSVKTKNAITFLQNTKFMTRELRLRVPLNCAPIPHPNITVYD